MTSSAGEKIAFKSNIGSHAEGKTLIEFLTGRFRYFDLPKWLELIEVGDVLVNSEKADSKRFLKNGDQVLYMATHKPEPRVPRTVATLYEDQDLLIVNKPPHLPVHPSGRYLKNTLINVLKAKRPNQLLVLSHRLDRETSGVCVLSKSILAKDKMYWAFYNGDVEKTYQALVWGIPKPASGVIDAPIGSAGGPIRIKQIVRGKDSKTARTKYKTLATQWLPEEGLAPPEWPNLLENKQDSQWPISLVECHPITGRTNQIRVHLAHLGCGVVGDKLYDPDEKVFLEFKSQIPPTDGDGSDETYMRIPPYLRPRLVLEAHALHARSLAFRHPRTGKKMVIEAPLPQEWSKIWSPRRSDQHVTRNLGPEPDTSKGPRRRGPFSSLFSK